MLTDQHVLGQPALVLGNAGGDAQSKTLLAQQGVSSIATAEGKDLPRVWQVGDQNLLRVAGPRVDQWSCRADRQIDELHDFSRLMSALLHLGKIYPVFHGLGLNLGSASFKVHIRRVVTL